MHMPKTVLCQPGLRMLWARKAQTIARRNKVFKQSSGKEIQNKDLTESATDVPRPGAFPLRSVESRAAARALLKSKASKQNTITIIYIDTDGKEIERTVSPTPADESLTLVIEYV